MFLVFCLADSDAVARLSDAQSPPYERTFAQSKAAVERSSQGTTAVGFRTVAGAGWFHASRRSSLGRFQRGYYQCAIQVISTPAGGALVRVSAKITAWYSDPASSKSGYQVLPSNGRLETDFLDRLEEALGGIASSSVRESSRELGAVAA